MEIEWYYIAGTERQGPVDENKLRKLLESQELQPDTLVWRKGLAEWQRASQLPELSGVLSPGSQVAAYPVPIKMQGADQSLAVIAFVCSVVGIFLNCCSACIGIPVMIAGIVVGHVALAKIKKDPDGFGGRALALAAVIIGYFVFSLMILAAVLLFTLQSSSFEDSEMFRNFTAQFEQYENEQIETPEEEMESIEETEEDEAAEQEIPLQPGS